jgi:hypothetical protein
MSACFGVGTQSEAGSPSAGRIMTVVIVEGSIGIITEAYDAANQDRQVLSLPLSDAVIAR